MFSSVGSWEISNLIPVKYKLLIKFLALCFMWIGCKDQLLSFIMQSTHTHFLKKAGKVCQMSCWVFNWESVWNVLVLMEQFNMVPCYLPWSGAGPLSWTWGVLLENMVFWKTEKKGRKIYCICLQQWTFATLTILRALFICAS